MYFDTLVYPSNLLYRHVVEHRVCEPLFPSLVILTNESLARYVKLRVAHTPGMPGGRWRRKRSRHSRRMRNMRFYATGKRPMARASYFQFEYHVLSSTCVSWLHTAPYIAIKTRLHLQKCTCQNTPKIYQNIQVFYVLWTWISSTANEYNNGHIYR